MTALTTLFPVFFMLFLGFLAKTRGWMTADQKSGANTLVFTILFPIMIFNLLSTAQLRLETMSVVLYVFIAFILAMVIGRLTVKFTGQKNAHFSHYLLTTCEGGSVALPLYLSIVGTSSTTVIFDLAGSMIAFLVIPIMVSRYTAKGQSPFALAKSILSHPFVIAIILGLIFNLTGLYSALAQSAFFPLYQGTMATATAPIVATILFVLGYDLSIDTATLGPILRLLAVRVTFYLLVILGFFLFFSDLMANKEFLIAVLIYFMSPTGFALPQLIGEVFKGYDDLKFSSTFISLYMLVTLAVYALVVVFIV